MNNQTVLYKPKKKQSTISDNKNKLRTLNQLKNEKNQWLSIDKAKELYKINIATSYLNQLADKNISKKQYIKENKIGYDTLNRSLKLIHQDPNSHKKHKKLNSDSSNKIIKKNKKDADIYSSNENLSSFIKKKHGKKGGSNHDQEIVDKLHKEIGLLRG
jgi:hypothetical protein